MEFSQTQKKVGYLLISVLFLISFLVYLPTIFNGFVYDDMEQVLGNPWIIDFTHLGDIFFSATWDFMKEAGGSNYYRPMMHLVFLVEQHLFGLSPKAFHLLNIILHSLNSVLLFLIASSLFRVWHSRLDGPFTASTQVKGQGDTAVSSLYWALAAALIFALHPINSEVVNWVSALPELSYTLFLLAAFYIYISLDLPGFVKGRIVWTALSVILFFLALISKETAMAFLLFIWSYDFVTRGPSFIKRYRNYIPYILTAVIYMVLRTYALGGFAQKKMVVSSFYDSVLNIFPITMRYIGKLIWPANLSIIYSYETFHSLFQSTVILSILAIVLIIIFLVVLRRRKWVIFPVLWIIIPLLPVLYIPVISTGGFADRYLYLPSAGFAILVAVIFRMFFVGFEKRKVAIVLLVVLFVVYAILTIQRSTVWRDSMSLWSDTVKSVPDNVIVNMGLAAQYRERGESGKAIRYYKRALKLNPFNYKPYYNLALIYHGMGEVGSAASNYLNTIRLNPLDDKAYFNLGALYHRSGENEKAIYYFKETIRVNPLNEMARGALAELYKDTSNPQAALSAYKEAVLVSPNSSTAHYNLAWSFQEAGDNLSAINSFKEAIRLDPGSANAVYGLAWVYHFIGDIPMAERFYKETVRVDPGGADAYFNLGLLYSNSGDFEGAVKNFKKVLEIDPDYREVKARLERVKAIAEIQKKDNTEKAK